MTKGEQFILDWLKEPYNQGADVLCSDLVDEFVEATGAKFHAVAYGAHNCPLLGRTLTRMYRHGRLRRTRVPLREMPYGFPKWVYSYTMRWFASELEEAAPKAAIGTGSA